MIASLPMYDWPETRSHLDTFWHSLQKNLYPYCNSVPPQLSRTNPQQQWQRDDLFLSQTCALPLVTTLPNTTVVIGTPNYACDYFENGHYACVIVVRDSEKRTTLEQFAGSTLAFNSRDSQSGYNALNSLVGERQPLSSHQKPLFSQSLETGSHRRSMQAVADGLADICSIDPVCWALATRFDDSASQLRVLTQTHYSPALPLISSKKAIPEDMTEEQWREAITQAFKKTLDNNARQHLMLTGITYIPKSVYFELPINPYNMIA